MIRRARMISKVRVLARMMNPSTELSTRLEKISCALFLIVILSGLLPVSVAATESLASDPSPYVRMHADDPVEWESLDASLLAYAQQQQRLIFVTVGYFSCYWCHVMQRESFLDEAIADRLNGDFISVVIDRELEPALDGVLQEFVQRTRGHGGWPLNVFLTPDGIPFYATVYQPPDRFLRLLERVVTAWRDERETLEAASREALALLERPEVRLTPNLDPGRGLLLRSLWLEEAENQADELSGGFGDQAKFPNAPQLLALLEAERAEPNDERADFLHLTLERIASQGLRDHLGGGFFRYTIDPQWQIPHFEKMLYDNAQLARVFLVATEQFGNAYYRDVAFDTLDFVLDELSLGDGSFASSLSAVDDHGVDGGYYLWQDDELDKLLDERERLVANALLGFGGPPLLDEGHLPIPGDDEQVVAASLGVDLQQVTRHLAAVRDKLQSTRERRVLPRDDKALAAWNGLLLEAFALAARSPDGERFRKAGVALRNWMADQVWHGDRLSRLVRENDRHAGELEDYAHVASGLLAWSRTSGKAEDVVFAAAVADAGYRRFFTPGGWRSSESSFLAIELREPTIADGALASPSARLGEVALELHGLNDLAAWQERGLRALNVGDDVLMATPFWHATHIMVMARLGRVSE